MDHKKYRYNHIGIPTDAPIKNEIYLPEYDMFVSDYETSEFNIEWVRFGENSPMPDIIKTVPHIAFDVDDIYEAIKDREVLIAPNRPIEELIVAFVLVDGAPVEFLQWMKKS